MNRTERLYAIAEELRRAGQRGRTAQRLADTFEVSTRTVKRDITALQQAGTPVWAAPGPGGGYLLDASVTLPALNFTAGQAVAVAAALAAQPDGPFAADGATALAKVLDVMDPAARHRAAQLAGRVWVRRPPRRSRHWRAVERALAERLVVAIEYVDAHGGTTRRRVEPMKLAGSHGHWYLVGWCRSRGAVRWFRADRVRAAHVTAEPVVERDLAIIGVPPPGAQPVLAGSPAGAAG